jgi:hypothetical protein
MDMKRSETMTIRLPVSVKKLVYIQAEASRRSAIKQIQFYVERGLTQDGVKDESQKQDGVRNKE